MQRHEWRNTNTRIPSTPKMERSPDKTKISITVNEQTEGTIDDVEEPSFNEICYIINHLKQLKAAGSDNLPSELFRYGARSLK